MPMTWNETTDARLLVGILTTTNVKLDMHALAKFMGPGCTVSAVQHRIQRLKDKVAVAPTSTSTTPGGTASSPGTTTTMTSPGNETPTNSTPATPEKRKRGRPRKNPVAGGGEASTTPAAAPAASTAKKPKAKRAKKAATAAAIVKKEDSSDDELSEPGVPETPEAGSEGVEESPIVKGEDES
ncbi:hypothetical protein AAWM_09531 [Aspergillus awamori]|uniref:Uncharacterized protein n=2 Tax=Aspergillus TaxID=5052 RepID=A0A3F3QDA9_9EURO|nr:hypothetical protein BDQ94DRAFT_167261 [Aspergillus welwitschiae]RDH37193.1 hypothetical protein BDQ94DRAFT_167261 [Aspergillus welwitschiae]GCB26646.1 hypothetical protein AAWM_09531 [Aspergillus awamori]GKZ55352.1 hypothetical protein AnigIFM49718_011716 [Aspergillus niger]